MKAVAQRNLVEQVARDEVEIVTARIMDQMGFSHGTLSTVDLLSDVAVRYLTKLCENVRLISEHCGRTSATMRDVQFAYHKMDVQVDELNEYMRQNRPLAPRLIPEFPAVPPKKLHKVAQIAPSSEQPEHLPSWAPPIYVTDFTTVASSSSSLCRPETVSIPDFSFSSATSLGLQRYREEPKPPSRTDSRESLPLSRAPSRADLFDSRPSSRSSSITAAVPMFKRRKRRPDGAQITPTPVQQPVPSVPIFTAADLAANHRPVMVAMHTGAAAPPPAPPRPAPPPPLVPSTLTHDTLTGQQEAGLSPRRILQMAVLRSLFVKDAELPDELNKAFDSLRENAGQERPTFAQPSPIFNFPPPPVPPPAPEPVYRIVPHESSSNEMPPGTLPPLKIKIARASLSGDPSPVVSIPPDSPSSPKAKRHKHKKKKHKKEKDLDAAPALEDVPLVSPRPAIRLKIRFGTT